MKVTTKRESAFREVFRRLFATIGKKKEHYFDYDLLIVLAFLTCFGLIMLYSTSAYSAQRDHGHDMFFFMRQAVFAAGSFVVMLVVSKIDYHIYAPGTRFFFIVSLLLLFGVHSPLGVEAYGARRWISLPIPGGHFTLQPAEIVKLTVILFVSYELCRLGKEAYTLRGAVRIIGIGVIAAAGVLFITSNLSTAIIVMFISCLLYFVVHPKMKVFIAILLTGAAALAGSLWFIYNHVDHATNFRMGRIIAWMNPEYFSDAGGFQVMQGLYAIGSGGFWGRGLGNSTQKLGVIPEVQNDMILAIIGEELGVFGIIVLLALFAMMLFRLIFIAQNAPDLFGSLLATGIFAHVSLQVILNVAVVTNTIPTTGVGLPFISYGGTALAFLMVEMGIALNISRKIEFR